uniref:Zinc finger protein ZIC 2-like isoform X2 n=1 Tax=Petromyzon marinus TaxID=7757 RepID=A0AAJ7WY68_PETMA|nr:zinc finger protein ZIC 2-like isoform X2 [Petromyzon marinus]
MQQTTLPDLATPPQLSIGVPAAAAAAAMHIHTHLARMALLSFATLPLLPSCCPLRLPEPLGFRECFPAAAVATLSRQQGAVIPGGLLPSSSTSSSSSSPGHHAARSVQQSEEPLNHIVKELRGVDKNKGGFRFRFGRGGDRDDDDDGGGGGGSRGGGGEAAAGGEDAVIQAWATRRGMRRCLMVLLLLLAARDRVAGRRGARGRRARDESLGSVVGFLNHNRQKGGFNFRFGRGAVMMGSRHF